MSKAESTPDPTTGIFHDGDEVAVRSKGRFSRKWHDPAVDGNGDVVFVDAPDGDVMPKPACGTGRYSDDVRFILTPVSKVDNRPKCTICNSSEDERSEIARIGADKASWARKMRYGDEWGT